MRFAYLVLLAGGVAACNGNQSAGGGSAGDMAVRSDDNADMAGMAMPDLEVPTLTIHLGSSSALGSFLVDGAGSTLYIDGRDVPGAGASMPTSNCSDACLATAPLFHATNFTVSAELQAADFTEFTRGDGQKQTAWHGWPLYYFAADEDVGDTMGQGTDAVRVVAAQPFYNVMVRGDGTMAQFLSDGGGKSLYIYGPDTRGSGNTPPVSNCTGNCVGSWPPYLADPLKAPATLTAGDFSVLNRSDSTKQLVYRGHPLYRYAGDTAPGQTNGRQPPTWNTLDAAAP